MDEKFLEKMFGSRKCPVIDLGLEDLARTAQKMAGGLSISGVQPKLSVKLDEKRNMLVPVALGGEYILKPQTFTFPDIPENEQCCMDIAGELDINIPLHCLIPLKDSIRAYVIKRFDRKKNVKIHQEDFSQVLGQTDKYKGSVEQIGRKLKEISSAPGYDTQLLFERVVLNFILGNGDAHLKNYSILYIDKDDIRLTPAYDIVCSKLVIPEEEDSAITINGKKNRLQRQDFDDLAGYLDIPVKVRYEKFGNKLDVMKKIIELSSLKPEKQRQFIEIIKERSGRLEL
ncbi:MAG: HipA domain-containing protein [Candidatus Omnitrophica bacterium]|nr:HipA domain-containing protein [Candidatus Omnitrophota bacterium]